MICSRSPASLTGILLSSAVVSYLFVVFIVSVSSNQTFSTSRAGSPKFRKTQILWSICPQSSPWLHLEASLLLPNFFFFRRVLVQFLLKGEEELHLFFENTASLPHPY